VDSVYDLVWADGPMGKVTYGDVFHQNEVEQSTYNFEHANTELLFAQFASHEAEAKRLVELALTLPAYEQIMKASHNFNMLDARGAISVTERAAYIGRVRTLSRLVAQAYYDSREKLGFPLAPGGACAAPRAKLPEPPDPIRKTMNQTLLVELLTEELPPKALVKLGAAFAAGISNGLKSRDFIDAGSVVTTFATPRRLAVSITEVRAVSPDKSIREKVLPVSVALDADGNPDRAAGQEAGRDGPRRRHRRPARTRRRRQGRELFYSYTAAGSELAGGLQAALDEALAGRIPADELPAPPTARPPCSSCARPIRCSPCWAKRSCRCARSASMPAAPRWATASCRTAPRSPSPIRSTTPGCWKMKAR
jgi:hypothetical protein